MKQACRWGAGGARVIQVGGGSRDLYYYPKDTVLVTAISPSLRKGVYPLLNISMGSLLADELMALLLSLAVAGLSMLLNLPC